MPHRKRSTAVIVLAGVFSLGILHPVQATSQADALSQQTISHVNKERAAKKAPRLAESACLKKYAQQQAVRMATQHNMKHQDLYAVGRACGLSAVGENLAVNYTEGRRVVAAWKRSACHRDNMLDRRFRLVGTAAVRDRDGMWFVAQVYGKKA